jgi:undecaprenyl diphosphate synthase
MSELQASTSTAVADDTVPGHVAIIMDGNHRWAKARHLPGAAGHRAGARNIRPIAERCADLGVRYLTIFALSTENLDRPKREVDLLLGLMRRFLEDNVDELHDRGVRLRVIGDRSRFAAELQMLMKRAEQMTRDNDQLHLTIAANYGGRWDITQAMRALAKAVRHGQVDPDNVDEGMVSGLLSMGDLPPPDLCIRTGGDQRISNFLLWDLAYSELYFTDAYWPEFNEVCLDDAMKAFRQRKRRFGRRA